MKQKDLNPGDRIIADGGFTCLRDGEICIVDISHDGLFVKCLQERHYLLGQQDKDGNLVGFKLEGE